jgi:hypothetical protein
MTRYQFIKASSLPLYKVFEYYADIEKYTHRYPLYYLKIDVIDRSENSISTKQYLNISLDEYEDRVNVDVKYTFLPIKEIQYEIKGYGEGAIKNSIWFRGKDTVGKPYECAAEINHVPLDIMHYTIENMERGKIRYNEYNRMIDYLREQDFEHLEHKKWRWRNGDSCNKCGKGTLQFTGEKEDTGTRKIEVLKCDSCHAKFSNQRIESHDTIIFDD